MLVSDCSRLSSSSSSILVFFSFHVSSLGFKLPYSISRYGFMFGRESARKELGGLIEELRRGGSNSNSTPHS
ncbi:hypothetical protein AXX17_AT4G20160 [Arabidopsis thaliana]|uniref:Uncharacterized protein n=1 Tax=Arabidopsis thaliana TaxID=3702 RepID=A0A178UYV7_ARATH|nr:hypothetical protein AXX17_AT4G20160 [Arabidopsis thaliana]